MARSLERRLYTHTNSCCSSPAGRPRAHRAFIFMRARSILLARGQRCDSLVKPASRAALTGHQPAPYIIPMCTALDAFTRRTHVGFARSLPGRVYGSRNRHGRLKKPWEASLHLYGLTLLRKLYSYNFRSINCFCLSPTPRKSSNGECWMQLTFQCADSRFLVFRISQL